MDKLVIAVIICFFPFIAFYPVDVLEPAKIDNITSSTRSDWGGDIGNPSHCVNSLEWTQHFSYNLQTGETREYWKWLGGCNV